MTGRMWIVRLEHPADYEGWRNAARRLVAAGVYPPAVRWVVGGAPDDDFFGDARDVNELAPGTRDVRAFRLFVELTQEALLHTDGRRFHVAHRLLHRLQADWTIIERPLDGDMTLLRDWAKAVRRDMHKMKAFVRFRSAGEIEGRERFVAWFEPSHHIVEATAPFFAERFANMDWTIVTPKRTAIHSAGVLSFGPGGSQNEVPAEDAQEEAWTVYYRSIFNPARIKLKAMQKEMPKKYWNNLPETAVIPDMLREAPARLERMYADAAPKATPVLETVMTSSYRSLLSLEDDEAKCTRCPLYRRATQVVPGEGPRHARVLMVGEQPGDQEDLSGKPFVGPAGKVLDAAMKEAGLDRSETFITNAVKHFKFEPRGKKRIHKRPNTGEIDACRWWLDHERALVKPELVIALGATAYRGVTGKTGTIARERGRIQKLPDGTALLVTIHPSFLLRITDPSQKAMEQKQFAHDLSLAAKFVAGLSKSEGRLSA